MRYATRIDAEILRAEIKHPHWPSDIVHEVATVNEEAGEALQAALECYYENGSIEDVEKELIHTAATAIRALAFLSRSPSRVDRGH